MLHLGIDEAGYGPVLGPFVVGGSCFRLQGDPAPFSVDLRARLKGLVARGDVRRADEPLPVPVDDSKVIHARFGPEGLARAVAAFAAAAGEKVPATLEALLDRWSLRPAREFASLPWGRDLARTEVPDHVAPGPLRAAFAKRHVEALALAVLPVDVPEWNGRIDEQRNKANVLGLYTGMLLLSLLERFPGEDAEATLDRHGGRLDYGAYLGGLFPFARVTQRPAAPGEARYDVDLDDRRLFVRFATKADLSSLAVSWASAAAKLVREMFMERMNDWFGRRVPGVRRTAGYRPDGERFAREVARVLEDMGIDRSRFVRAL